jgi:hypothetical protein
MLLQLFQVFPGGQRVRLIRPLDQCLRDELGVFTTKTTLQHPNWNNKRSARIRYVWLYLTVRPQGLLQLRDVEHGMNAAARRKLEAISCVANTLQHGVGAVILEE